MNINSINRVKIVGKVDGYVEEMLNRSNETIENIAKNFGRDVRIAQKGTRVLVNSGVRTSSFDYKEMQSTTEFKRNIIDNIVTNQKISEAGFNKLA